MPGEVAIRIADGSLAASSAQALASAAVRANVVLETGVPAFSFTFGIPPDRRVVLSSFGGYGLAGARNQETGEAGRTLSGLLFDVAATQRLFRGGRADVDVQAAVLNLFDEAFAYNFANAFSGTHFGAGRTVQAGVRVSFR